ncbi:V-set domain containing T-cell activation inhibitor 1 [Dissostichus eleginoides]|uniref:V-set domain containing T-cell activation inhibitor 1 n=1 Tax=Dissostichus eleginoides TaxID=100907 RepID=A0AAD9CF26_DISEL|nr:V-set domain containing T-cell activation inhibitor 1 [Dissostichus eleginoides]
MHCRLLPFCFSPVTEVKAKPGEDVTLPCKSPTDAAITLVRWNRSDLEDYVFFFRDNKLIRSFQNLSFHDRVELKDPEMTNSDSSVVLKNVSVIDTGTYTCWRNGKFVSSVHLSVSEECFRGWLNSQNVEKTEREKLAVTEVKAKPGEDVTLHCNCPTDAAITLVQCKISGLEDNVFYFRDNKLMESLENPQFHGRVELKDPEMKNGDCSVVLKNISVIDTGTYTCLVLTERNEKFVASVHLSVSEGEFVFFLKIVVDDILWDW